MSFVNPISALSKSSSYTFDERLPVIFGAEDSGNGFLKGNFQRNKIEPLYWRLPPTTVDGRTFKRFGPDDTSDFKALSKEVINTVVFENLKRIEEGLPLIPLFFIIKKRNYVRDYGSRSFSTDFIALTKRVPKDQKRITDCELRRCYKLCTFPDKRVAEAAKATLHFVSLKIYKGACKVKVKDPFWEKSAWQKAWAKRSPQDIQAKPWSHLLQSELQAYDAERNAITFS